MNLFNKPDQWDGIKEQFPIGTEAKGIVIVVMAFGVFLDLGDEVVALLRITDMAGGVKKVLDEYPQINEVVTARVLCYDDRHRQVVLTQKS